MTTKEMIDLLNNDLRNEWKHLRFYLYHASAITGFHREEYRELLLKNAASEMGHVTAFSDVIYGLGGVATDESAEFKKFSSDLQTFTPKEIFHYALVMEEEVVANYVQRMKDANELGGVDGQWLEIFLEGQIQDSREDVDNLRQILR